MLLRSIIATIALLAITSILYAESEPLVNVAQIRALSREQAAAKLPVHIRGVVILRTKNGIHLHDGVESIWADNSNLPTNVIDGSFVEIQGFTDQIGYSPRILIASIQYLGNADIPPAQRVPMDRLLSGAKDAQRIELEGVVQEAVPASGDYLPLFVLAVEGKFCRVKIFGNIDPRQFIDARVRIRGIYTPQVNLRNQAVGLELASRPHDIEILSPPPSDPFLTPHVHLKDLMGFSPTGISNHRKVVSGCVTFIYPGSFFYIREDDLSLRIDGGTDGIRVGDKVEVAGFSSLTHTLASLHGIVLRHVGQTIPPEVTDSTTYKILHPVLSDPWAGTARTDQSGMVVRLRGRLLRTFFSPDNATRTLLIDSEGGVFPAHMPASVAPSTPWLPGSDLELTGVCELEFKSELNSPNSITHPVDGFHLWLSSTDSVHVLAVPSWWTPQRLVFALGSAMMILLGALAWGAWLRREVSRRGLLLAIEIAARKESRLEYEATIRERTRLANDLHDNLEQTLTGLSLQLQAADLFRRDEPERSEQHLLLAQQFLERSREDLHRTVWDLRALGMEGKGVAECLRDKSATMTTEGSAAIVVQVSGEEQSLPDFIAGNLLLLAQEAITNALKHANAKQITVDVNYRADGVVISVVDDGRGFILTEAPGHREGHFGLQGMRERTKRMGGSLDINSRLGQGTRIEVSVPATAFYDPSPIT